MAETQNNFNLVVVAVIALVAIVSIAALVLGAGGSAAAPAAQFVQPNIESADWIPLTGELKDMCLWEEGDCEDASGGRKRTGVGGGSGEERGGGSSLDE